MISQNVTEKIFDYLFTRGATYAEIYSEHTIKNQITLCSGQVSETLSGVDAGIGIRFLDGTGWQYLSSSDEREAALFHLLGDKEQERAVHPVRRETPTPGADGMDLSQKLALLRGCDTAGRGVSSQILSMRIKYMDIDQRVQIANSEGLCREDVRQKTNLMIQALAGRDGETVSLSRGFGARAGLEFYEQIEAGRQAEKIAQGACNLLGGVPCPTGVMPVVIANGFGGLFFHEACGHSLEAAAVCDGGSEFSDCLGRPVASGIVTLVDDGSMPGGLGSGDIDDEGVSTRKNVLIRDGILQTYLSDRASAERIGIKPNGSSRRESYRYAPSARMSNTYIAPGTTAPEAMVASVEEGLYVKSILGGSVNCLTGEFHFETTEAFLIRHGEITSPVKRAVLMGVGGEILKKIEMVGDDFQLGQGFCYAGSGTLFIGAGQPSIKVAGMFVTGDGPV